MIYHDKTYVVLSIMLLCLSSDVYSSDPSLFTHYPPFAAKQPLDQAPAILPRGDQNRAATVQNPNEQPLRQGASDQKNSEAQNTLLLDSSNIFTQVRPYSELQNSIIWLQIKLDDTNQELCASKIQLIQAQETVVRTESTNNRLNKENMQLKCCNAACLAILSIICWQYPQEAKASVQSVGNKFTSTIGSLIGLLKK